MQVIYRTKLTPEQYAEQNYQKQVRPPESCCNCGKLHALKALAYYERYITAFMAAVLQIWVRRFLCRFCGISVSCLPEFAQPYRVVNTATVTDGFNGLQTAQVRRWSDHIGSYWRSFNRFLDKLLRTVGNALGPLPLRPTASGFWQMLLRRFSDLGAATEELVHRFRLTLFGKYRCHQRRQLQAA